MNIYPPIATYVSTTHWSLHLQVYWYSHPYVSHTYIYQRDISYCRLKQNKQVVYFSQTMDMKHAHTYGTIWLDMLWCDMIWYAKAKIYDKIRFSVAVVCTLSADISILKSSRFSSLPFILYLINDWRLINSCEISPHHFVKFHMKW